jgi:hypothetical protein
MRSFDLSVVGTAGGRLVLTLVGLALPSSLGTSWQPAPQIGGPVTGKSWCTYHDQSSSSPAACVGAVSICSAGSPQVSCCTHQHEALKWWDCANGGERRRGPTVKKYYQHVSGECFLDQCLQSSTLACPEHWVEECKTLDCF